MGAGRGGGGGGEGETSLGDEQSLAGESQGAERVGGLMSKVLVFLTDREQMQTADRDRADRCPYVLIGTSQAGVRARWYLGPTYDVTWGLIHRNQTFLCPACTEYGFLSYRLAPPRHMTPEHSTTSHARSHLTKAQANLFNAVFQPALPFALSPLCSRQRCIRASASIEQMDAADATL